MNISGQWNEQQVAAAFSKQAGGFDDYDGGNTIIHYKRNRVRAWRRVTPAKANFVHLSRP